MDEEILEDSEQEEKDRNTKAGDLERARSREARGG